VEPFEHIAPKLKRFSSINFYPLFDYFSKFCSAFSVLQFTKPIKNDHNTYYKIFSNIEQDVHSRELEKIFAYINVN